MCRVFQELILAGGSIFGAETFYDQLLNPLMQRLSTSADDTILLPELINTMITLVETVTGDKITKHIPYFVKVSLFIINKSFAEEQKDSEKVKAEQQQGKVKTSNTIYLDFETSGYAESENNSVTSSFDLLTKLLDTTSTQNLNNALFNQEFYSTVTRALESHSPYILNSCFSLFSTLIYHHPQQLGITLPGNTTLLNTLFSAAMKHRIPEHLLKNRLYKYLLFYVILITLLYYYVVLYVIKYNLL